MATEIEVSMDEALERVRNRPQTAVEVFDRGEPTDCWLVSRQMLQDLADRAGVDLRAVSYEP